MDEYDPKEYLGKSYEALDPIRMDSSCYIIWDDCHSALKLMGDDVEKIKTASALVRGVFFQVVATHIEVGHLYLLELPTDGRVQLNIRLSAYYSAQGFGGADFTNTKEATVIADIVRASESPKSLLYEAEQRSRRNAKKLRDITFHMLDRIRYYKGNVGLQFRLGTFILSRYRQPPNGGWTFEEFESMLKEEQFEAFVSQE